MGATAEWNSKPEHNFSPRVKMALRLYGTGAARTQKEAAEIAGVSSQSYISRVKKTTTGSKLLGDLETQIQERAVSLSAVIAKLSEKALDVMEQQIDNGSTEQVKFQAAKDILDRNPETSKTNKVQVESFSLSGRDAKEISAALVEGRLAADRFAEVEQGDFVKVEEAPQLPPITGEVPNE